MAKVDGPASEFVENSYAKPRASSPVQGASERADVARLAQRSAGEALALARKIGHPWYRCQAIASVVEENPSIRNASALLAEALEAAYSQDEPNRVVSVSFWPLRLLAKQYPVLAAENTARLLKIIADEPHGLRRLDGLCAILGAVVSQPELRQQVLAPLLEAAHVSSGWRTERLLNGVIQALVPYDRQAALSLLQSRPATRFTKESRALLLASNAP